MKKKPVLALAVVVATVLGVVSAQQESEVQRGLQAVPALITLDLQGKNLALVGKGSYLVNVIGATDVTRSTLRRTSPEAIRSPASRRPSIPTSTWWEAAPSGRLSAATCDRGRLPVCPPGLPSSSSSA